MQTVFQTKVNIAAMHTVDLTEMHKRQISQRIDSH